MELMKSEQALFDELSEMIEQGRRTITAQVNNTAILTFWRVGKRMNEVVLQNKRAEYGKQIVSTLSTQLKEKYGRSFELRNLRRMMQFADEFPDAEIVSTLSTQLSWSHFIELLPLKSTEARLYYANDATYQFPLTPCDVEIEFELHKSSFCVSAKNMQLLLDALRLSDGFFVEKSSNGEKITLSFRVRYAYTEITEVEPLN